MKDRRARRIWLITGAGSAAAGSASAVLVRLPSPPLHFPFIGLVVLFAAAEVMVVHVETRSQSHTFSLVEVPLVVGLLADPPWALVPAHVLGAAAVLILVRHQPWIKVAYNLTAFAIEAVSAQLVFHAFSNGANMLAGATMAGVFAATLTASLIGIGTVFLVFHLTEGSQPRADRYRQLVFGSAATGVTTSTTLIGAVLYSTDTPALWLLALPIAGVYLAEKLYTAQMREHRRLQLLRNSTALVSGLGSDESIESLLQQVRHTFHAATAALTYLPGGLPDSLALAVVGATQSGSGPPELAPPVEAASINVVGKEGQWEAWAALAPGRSARIVTAAPELRQLAELIGLSGVKQAMVVPLCGDLNVIGYLAVVDRLPDTTPFSGEDLEVLDTLERFVSIGLANGHLEQSLEEARLLERQLVHRATHDSLTGLANRTLMSDHLTRLLADSGDQDIACLFVDLDDFKSINDNYGHATGDQLLSITAQRLVNCLRDGDLAARLGGDEMAVVAHVAKGAEQDAAALGERIVEQLSRPVSVRGNTVATSASVGIVICQSGERAADVLAAADEAMYSAKLAGKGRAMVFRRDQPVGDAPVSR